MATVENFTPLNLITDQTNDWKICIRVHINWRKTYLKNPNNASSLEMILVDQQGFKIRATTDRQGMTFFGDTFKEGEYFVLSNFRVGKHDDDVKLIQHAFKIHLSRTTKVIAIRNNKVHDLQAVITNKMSSTSILVPT
ncbi:uncharacterized protein [Rutidosis leptorrhynchoides]|uniref:uncharacterized protein n=1 Tax=Rutidosis leptorrhynchoides TaxID=125765 RepID=UPI003A98F2EB